MIDLARRRILAAGASHGEEARGSEPRDAVLAPGDRALYLIRADAGIVRVPLARWRYLDGTRLLAATRGALPRPLAPGEISALGVGEG